MHIMAEFSFSNTLKCIFFFNIYKTYSSYKRVHCFRCFIFEMATTRFLHHTCEVTFFTFYNVNTFCILTIYYSLLNFIYSNFTVF